MTADMVKRFDPTKKSGFVALKGGDKDVFVHYSAIDGGGHRELAQGRQVQFELGPAAQGRVATRVRLV